MWYLKISGAGIGIFLSIALVAVVTLAVVDLAFGESSGDPYVGSTESREYTEHFMEYMELKYNGEFTVSYYPEGETIEIRFTDPAAASSMDAMFYTLYGLEVWGGVIAAVQADSLRSVDYFQDRLNHPAPEISVVDPRDPEAYILVVANGEVVFNTVSEIYN